MTRSPRRRLVAVVAAGLLAVGGLAACRADAGAAAYVGNTRITNDEVNRVANAEPGHQADRSNARVAAVTLTVFNVAAAKYAAARDIAAPRVTANDIDQIVSAQQLAPSEAAAARPWLELEAEAVGWVNTLMATAPATTSPTDADYQRLFTELKADFPPNTTLAQAKQTFQQVPGLAQGVALRNQLESAFAKYNIQISPQYANNCTKAPCAAPYIPLVQVQGQTGPIDVVNLPLTKGQPSPPAIDLPAAAPTVAPQG